MSKLTHRLAALSALAAVLVTFSSARAAYSDEYVSVSSDEVTVIDLGSDICYVFSNAVDGVALTTKKQMMLRSYLVVGGGGSGGGQLGGGGGGGGVTNGVDVNLSIAADTVFMITVGAGAPQPASASVRGENGSHSSLAWGTTTIWGGGGGGGGSWSGAANNPPRPAEVENQIGSGGGGGAYNSNTRGGGGGSGTVILKFAKKDYRQYLFTASLAETKFNFTGYEIRPEPMVVHQLGGAPLVKGEEYTVRYENNMGFYGNTPWATRSPVGMAVRVR